MSIIMIYITLITFKIPKYTFHGDETEGDWVDSKNYVETRKYNIDLQIYIGFVTEVRERIHDFRNGGRYTLGNF